MRATLEAEGFLEVETPARVVNPGQELHLDALPAGDDRWLITSPEHHMKRLLGAGFPRIFQIARCFRRGERGPHHQPEFTMLEWYRADPDLDIVARDCERLLEAAGRAIGRWPTAPVPAGRGGGALSLAAPFDRTTVRDLFARFAGFPLCGDEPATELRDRAVAAGIPVTAGTDAWDDLFFQIFLDRIEARLGRDRPTFVFDWPQPLGALARRKADDPRVVDRFELYAGGLELVNAFGELTDPVEQRTRFAAEAELRRARGKAVYPLDERLLSALPRMPASCGAAMGLDRLVMLLLGAEDIREVLTFADDET